MKFTTKGRITLLRDGTAISTHVLAEEAYERAFAHASANGPGKYTVRYPDREVDLSTLTRTILESAPAGLQSQAVSASSINLTWTANPRATGYRVYRNGTLIGSPTTNSYSDTGLSASTSYTYTVSTVAASGEGPQGAGVQGTTLAAPDTTAPTAPVITATATSQNTISVALTTPATDSQSGVASYDLEYKTAAASTYTAITGLTAGQFPYVIGSLTQATAYNTRARARDGVGNIGPYSAVSNATTQGAVGGAITPSLVVEYVDAAGNDQRVAVNNDGSTTITGIAPLLVTLKATGTRAQHSSGNTFSGNWWHNGHRVNWGENRGGTWPYSGASRIGGSRDQDEGPPIFGHPYETVGTHTLRYRCRDAIGNEATVNITVVVSAPPAATIIETSAGSWPTPVSGTHYQLRAGADYSSFGDWNIRRVHNVLVSKTGSGADPIVGEMQIGKETTGDLTVTRERTRHVRFLNIDMTAFYSGIYGGLHCGAINGRVRRVYQDNSRNQYESTTTTTQRAQVTWPRGFYLYNTGLMNSGFAGYLIVGDHYRMFHCQGARLQHPANATNQHILRFIQHESTMRNCQIFSDGYGPYVYRVKMQAEGTALWDSSSELIGPLTGSAFDWYRYSNSYNIVESISFGGPGDQPPNAATISFDPQNDEISAQDELHEYIALENCTDTRSAASCVRGGRELGARGLRNPDTTSWGLSEINWNPNRIPPGAFGPYVSEADNSRPLPSAP